MSGRIAQSRRRRTEDSSSTSSSSISFLSVVTWAIITAALLLIFDHIWTKVDLTEQRNPGIDSKVLTRLHQEDQLHLHRSRDDHERIPISIAEKVSQPHFNVESVSEKIQLSPTLDANPITITSSTSTDASITHPDNLLTSSSEAPNGNYQCSSETEDIYNKSGTSEEDLKAMQWCKDVEKTYGVIIGRSWGGLLGDNRKIWDINSCNDLIRLGSVQTCNEKFGWKFFDDWLAAGKATLSLPNESTLDGKKSYVACAENMKTNVFCISRNVVLDFSKVSIQGQSRRFQSGFLKIFGTTTTNGKDLLLPEVPGLQISRDEFYDTTKCDVVENRPVLVLTNDDTGNLGHYINDVGMMWNMGVLANIIFNQTVLLNIDGIRASGPAGGPLNRILNINSPDDHGRFVGYYNSWFQELQQGIQYQRKKQKVCFKEIYFQPIPGVPWFWNDWGIINKCSTLAPSPLYQSFNLFIRDNWRRKYGTTSLPYPDTDKVHIVIEVRAIDKKKRNNHSSARFIRNLKELQRALKSIPGVRVTAQNFALLSFEKQVALSHSAGVMLSMHGAGTTHIFHSALGSPNCCALVELFPDSTVELISAYGYGNLARMFGMHHWRYEPKLGATSSQGTTVDVAKIKQLTELAVEAVRSKPTCLHNIKDTTSPIYRHNMLDRLQ